MVGVWTGLWNFLKMGRLYKEKKIKRQAENKRGEGATTAIKKTKKLFGWLDREKKH